MILRNARMSSLADKIEERDDMSIKKLEKEIEKVKKSTPKKKRVKRSRSKSKSKRSK